MFYRPDTLPVVQPSVWAVKENVAVPYLNILSCQKVHKYGTELLL